MNAEQLRALPEWTVLTSHRPDGSYYTCLIKSNVDEWDAAYETHSSAEVASWGHSLTIVARPVTHPCTCREDVACGACMSGATDPTTATSATPPADDVREAVFTIAKQMTPITHEPLASHVASEWAGRIMAVVRPRGTVTDAEVEAAAQAIAEVRFRRAGVNAKATKTDADMCMDDARAALEAAREVQP